MKCPTRSVGVEHVRVEGMFVEGWLNRFHRRGGYRRLPVGLNWTLPRRKGSSPRRHLAAVPLPLFCFEVSRLARRRLRGRVDVRGTKCDQRFDDNIGVPT